MTWKGQLGVWRNLSSLMDRWGTVLRVERHQQRSTRLMGFAANTQQRKLQISCTVKGKRKTFAIGNKVWLCETSVSCSARLFFCIWVFMKMWQNSDFKMNSQIFWSYLSIFRLVKYKCIFFNNELNDFNIFNNAFRNKETASIFFKKKFKFHSSCDRKRLILVHARVSKFTST